MFIHVNNINLYYKVVGTGTPLIMVHGNGEDHTIFDEAARILATRFTCYLLDSRDHGKSTRVESLDYDSMADDVLAFMDALGLNQPVYYGFSDGGIIGLIAASKRPGCFRRMIISGANTHPRGLKTWLYRVFQVINFFKRDPKIRMMLEQPQITRKQLSRIQTPTLVLAGSKDLIKESHTRQLAAGIPNSELKILPGEGHGSYIVHNKKIGLLILNACKND